MGDGLIAYAFGVGLTLILYALLVPDTFKDFADLAAFTSWRHESPKTAIEVWGEVNRNKGRRKRAIIILIAGISLALFVVFVYFCFRFLDHSLDCNLQLAAPHGVRLYKG